MKQYLDLLSKVYHEGDKKGPAREGLPGTRSLFGPQMEFDMKDGFPIITTKEIKLETIAIELLWFLRKESNIGLMINNKVNIWNEDAYNYYILTHPESKLTFKEFCNRAKLGLSDGVYTYGDTGNQYPNVWRNFGGKEGDEDGVDQIVRVIENLSKFPDSRRHLVSAVDVTNDQDLALYWCHSLFQFNCRKLSHIERCDLLLAPGQPSHVYGNTTKGDLDDFNIPEYYLDCKLYQRSGDVFLGVPFNISSYALLTQIICQYINMEPGRFIHTFGDVHLYDNHHGEALEQLGRTPLPLPKLVFEPHFYEMMKESISVDNFLMGLHHSMFTLKDYKHEDRIKATLNTGLVDNSNIQGANDNNVLWEAVKPRIDNMGGKVILVGNPIGRSDKFKELWDKASDSTPYDIDGNPNVGFVKDEPNTDKDV